MPFHAGSTETTGPVEQYEGLTIDYTIRWLGLPMGWTSVITQYDPPNVFVDEQVRGHYHPWRHRHEFVGDGDCTITSDRVRYSLPLGPLGRIAQAVLVKRQLLGIFRFRQRTVAGLLKAECAPVEAPVIVQLGR